MTTVTQLEPLVDVKALAAHLGMSPRWIEYRIKDGMPTKFIGTRRRFRASECEDWLVKEGFIQESGQ